MSLCKLLAFVLNSLTWLPAIAQHCTLNLDRAADATCHLTHVRAKSANQNKPHDLQPHVAAQSLFRPKAINPQPISHPYSLSSSREHLSPSLSSSRPTQVCKLCRHACSGCPVGLDGCPLPRCGDRGRWRSPRPHQRKLPTSRRRKRVHLSGILWVYLSIDRLLHGVCCIYGSIELASNSVRWSGQLGQATWTAWLFW